MKRGRPRIYYKCTPELKKKHSMSLTKDPVDLCLEYGYINLEQHQYGLRFRWLYRKRFGNKMIKSQIVDATKQKSYYNYTNSVEPTKHEIDLNDEYTDLIMHLEKEKCLKIIQNLWIYSCTPLIVILRLASSNQVAAAETHLTASRFLKASDELRNIQQAMKCLCDFYLKKQRNYQPLQPRQVGLNVAH